MHIESNLLEQEGIERVPGEEGQDPVFCIQGELLGERMIENADPLFRLYQRVSLQETGEPIGVTATANYEVVGVTRSLDRAVSWLREEAAGRVLGVRRRGMEG